MKRIGKGWQYTVFDIGSNRIRKVFNNKIQSMLAMLISCFPYIKYPLYKFPKYYRSIKQKAIKSIDYFGYYSGELNIFANPVFLNELDYEQDKVTLIKNYIKRLSEKDVNIIIEKFILLNKFLLKMSIIDESFNFCKNFGVDDSGNLVLIDLGELIINKSTIIIQLKKRPWASLYVNICLSRKMRRYFIREMDKNFL